MFEKFMLFLSTFVVGFFALCIIIGFCGKFLNFKIEVEGFMVWIVAGVIGWLVLKALGMY